MPPYNGFKKIMKPKPQRTIQQGAQCIICAKNNPKTAFKPPQRGAQHRGPYHPGLENRLDSISLRSLFKKKKKKRVFEFPQTSSVGGYFFRMGGSISYRDKVSEVVKALLRETIFPDLD